MHSFVKQYTVWCSLAHLCSVDQLSVDRQRVARAQKAGRIHAARIADRRGNHRAARVRRVECLRRLP